MLVLYYFVLGIFRQKGRRPVDSWVWQLVDDLKHFDRYPWGAYSYLTLCHNLRLVKHKTGEKNYNFFGPVWALYVWALELVPGMAALTAICLQPSALPRCLKWQFLSIIKGPRGMKPEEKNKALHEVFVKVNHYYDILLYWIYFILRIYSRSWLVVNSTSSSLIDFVFFVFFL